MIDHPTRACHAGPGNLRRSSLGQARRPSCAPVPGARWAASGSARPSGTGSFLVQPLTETTSSAATSGGCGSVVRGCATCRRRRRGCRRRPRRPGQAVRGGPPAVRLPPASRSCLVLNRRAFWHAPYWKTRTVSRCSGARRQPSRVPLLHRPPATGHGSGEQLRKHFHHDRSAALFVGRNAQFASLVPCALQLSESPLFNHPEAGGT